MLILYTYHSNCQQRFSKSYGWILTKFDKEVSLGAPRELRIRFQVVAKSGILIPFYLRVVKEPKVMMEFQRN